MNRVELQKGIQAALLSLSSVDVFYKDAPHDTTFPYVTYEIPDSYDARPGEEIRLIVDVWDTAEDITALETLVETIDGDGNIHSPTGMNRKKIKSGSAVIATCYRERKSEVPDNDVIVNRRQIEYRIKAY